MEMDYNSTHVTPSWYLDKIWYIGNVGFTWFKCSLILYFSLSTYEREAQQTILSKLSL